MLLKTVIATYYSSTDRQSTV